MSLQEIVDQIPKLSAEELELLGLRIDEARKDLEQGRNVQQLMEALAGTVDDLPEDYSAQLDHYLYGLPKR